MNRKILVFLLLFLTNFLFAQHFDANKELSLKVKIIDAETKEIIDDATVTVNGRRLEFSRTLGRYQSKARKGDELFITHPDFHSVYHTIANDGQIEILVEGLPEKKKSKINSWLTKSRKKAKRISTSKDYPVFLDSAKQYQKKDIEKSLFFIEKTLKLAKSSSRIAASYEVLGDTYLFWKQYDLAIENYKQSLQARDKNVVHLQLAKAQFLFKKYAESEKTYKQCLNKELSKYQRLLAHEGLGDLYRVQEQFMKSRNSYEKALELAKSNLVTPKITDINSKLAELYAKYGKTNEADSLFQNSLNLANKENIRRSIKQEEKVADYFNTNQRFDEEIELRKESLKKTSDISIETEDKESLIDSITAQKINYKIGRAYAQKESYNEAIDYFQQSIKDADKNEDLIVKKAATKKLSEVYAAVGNYPEALKKYQEYAELVDSTYTLKEQEIHQVKQFSRRIREHQNRIKSLEKDKELYDSRISLANKDQELISEINKRQEVAIYSLIIGMILVFLLVYFMYRNIRQQKLANNLLALKSMRSQMNPHFIFNALNSVNSFIAVNDERSANRYLSEFSILMRSVLENSDEDFIPLSKEIELLQLYVKLEHNRFQDKFEYAITIDEKIDIDSFLIPPMLLQPYIENAIWHGLRYRKEKGKLLIVMKQKKEDVITILIEDNGIGRKKSIEMKTKNQLKQKSKGMSTIKRRIAILNDMYQEKITVSIKDKYEDGTGTVVALKLKKITI